MQIVGPLIHTEVDISNKLKAGHCGRVMNYVPFDVVKYAMNILDKHVPCLRW